MTHGLGTIDPLARTTETLRRLPLSFEANDGRTDPQVDFIARGRGYAVFLTPREAVLAFHGPPTSSDGHGSAPSSTAALRVRLKGARAHPRGVGLERLPGTIDYFLGNDPARWRRAIPTWARVRYHEVYPGVDLVYYGTQGQLEYDFVVRPGADPGRIVLGFEGAEKIGVDGGGDLVLHMTGRVIRHRKPVIYQEVDGSRRAIGGGYVLNAAREVGFKVAAYDRRRPLIIDPVLFYSTYLGGADGEDGGGIAVDADGYVYVTGRTPSIDFPATAGAFRTTVAGLTDAFIAKLDPAGSALVYSTYLGGAGSDHGNAIAVDTAGNAYVTGETQSTDFPTTPGAFQPTPPARLGNTTFVAFVAKLDPTGSALVYSTYLGGGADGQAAGIAVDASGYAYISGTTSANDFPTTLGAFQTTRNGQSDAVVAKLNPTGSALVYATYLGGGSTEHGEGIAIDADGNAYVTGRTSSGDFPTTPGAFQTTKASGPSSHAAFVTKLNPSGSALVYSTYLAGTGSDRGVAIAIDAPSNPNAYVTGRASSTDFPTTPGAFRTTAAGLREAYLTKLNPTGSALVYSTYLGGAGDDETTAVAADAAGSAYVTGETASTDFPVTAGAPQATLAGPTDAFVTKLDPSGSALAYSTYLGGAGDETSTGIAVDAFGSAYVTGVTTSTDFPATSGAFDTTFNGIQDAFVVKVAGFGQPATLTLAPNAATNPVNTQHCVTAAVQDSAGNPVPGVTARFTVTGSVTAAGSARTDATGQATFCYMGPSTPGSDSIAAFADTNNNAVQDAGEPSGTATKTWVAGAPATLTLAPPDATNPVSTQHCVTATATDAFGNAVPGVMVAFTVTGAMTTAGSAQTDATGQATFCYMGPSTPGSDSITAFADTNNNAVQDAGEPSGTATKTWVAGAAATLTLFPQDATNPVSTQHCVTATVQDSAANPVPGVTVPFTVTGSVSATGSAPTDASGQATFCYMGPAEPGSDSIAAFADTNNSGVQDPGEPGATATKTWVLP